MGADKSQPQRGTNWVEARDFWLALDPPRSFETVAKQFGVSAQRVGFIARRDGWREIAADIDAQSLEAVKNRVILSREERNAQFLRIVDAANAAALDKLTANQLEVKLSDLPALGKHAELILGEATDRVSFSELQEALGVVMAIAVEFVPTKARATFLQRVRERLGQVGGDSA